MAERWSLMRLSVKNERPLYNAYRGGILSPARSLSLSLALSFFSLFLSSLSLSLFVSSIRNLISHESERRLSPFYPSSSSRLLFSPFLSFFLCEKQTDALGRCLPVHELLFSLPLNVDNVTTENFSWWTRVSSSRSECPQWTSNLRVVCKIAILKLSLAISVLSDPAALG